jgi:hypothetical protein
MLLSKCDTQLTDRDVWTPFSVIRVRPNEKEGHELYGEDYTRDVQQHRIHCYV